MNLLAIDTALEACSVGVAARRGDLILRSEIIGRGHAERLFGMIGEAMSEAGVAFSDLDRIAVTVGPGSFTGVRVGIAAARGLALVAGCPAVGIGTLAAIAEEARAAAGPVPVLAVIDARRGQVYAQVFSAEGMELTPPAADSPERFAGHMADGMVLAGPGAALVAARAGGAQRVAGGGGVPDIAAVVRLGLAAPDPAGPPRPLYLRAPDARPQTAALPRQ